MSRCARFRSCGPCPHPRVSAVCSDTPCARLERAPPSLPRSLLTRTVPRRVFSLQHARLARVDRGGARPGRRQRPRRHARPAHAPRRPAQRSAQARCACLRRSRIYQRAPRKPIAPADVAVHQLGGQIDQGELLQEGQVQVEEQGQGRVEWQGQGRVQLDGNGLQLDLVRLVQQRRRLPERRPDWPAPRRGCVERRRPR